MTEIRVEFPCGKLSLEGILSLPEGRSSSPAVVICHPHPLFGGDMNNNVVMAVFDGLQQASIACLKFNFRGVGRSEGKFAQGIGERQDVRAALTFLGDNEAVDNSKLGLCGYSFGTIVALPVTAEDERVQTVAGISPFPSSVGLLKHYAGSKLFLCGDSDGFISSDELQRVIDRLPEPKRYEIIAGADHFWWGYESEIAAKVSAFFTAALESR
jgi:hypothetical protein